MAKIKILGAWRGHAPGDVVECAAADARLSIAAGVAVPVRPKRERAVKTPPETRGK